MVARVRRVGDDDVVRRQAAGLEQRVKVLVPVVHEREAERREVARHRAVAKVRVVDAQLRRLAAQRARHQPQQRRDVRVRLGRRLAVVLLGRLEDQRLWHRVRHRRGRRRRRC